MFSPTRSIPPLYHVLDGVWDRFPFPYSPQIELEEHGPVTALRMARMYFGHVLLDVRCFAVGNTLIDTGLRALGSRLVALVPELGIDRAILTHHHEDHSGNAAALVRAGVEVSASPLTAAIMRRGFPIRFYEHLCWGKSAPVELPTLGDTTRVGRHEAHVIRAPGHAVDQVAFHVPERGWLFSGDAFVHERVRYFRQDEDFHATIGTLRRFLELDFDALFCSHRPRLTGGKQAIQTKLEWLQDLEGRVREWEKLGVDIQEMGRRLDDSRGFGIPTVSLGDASAENLVRSILEGPRPRPEIARAVEAADAG